MTDLVENFHPLLYLISFALWLLIYFYTKNFYKITSPFKQTYKFICLILILIFSVYAFWAGDFYNIYFEYPDLGDHYETPYIFLSKYIDNYYLFRLIVWGGAVFFLNLTFNRIQVSNNLLIISFIIFNLIWFSYARVSLAMSIMFYGVAIICHPYRYKFLSYFLAILCFCASFFLHKSALFGLLVIFIALIVVNSNHRLFKSILLLIIASTFFVDFFTENLLILDSEDSKYLDIQSAQYYLTEYSTSGSFFLTILRWLEYFPVLILSYLVVKNSQLFTAKNIGIPFEIRLFSIILCIITAFFISLYLNSSVREFSGRFIRYSYIPLAISASFLYERNLWPKKVKLIFRLGLISSFVQLFYSLFGSLVAWF